LSKTTAIILFIFIALIGLIIIVIFQVPTSVTAPITNTIKSYTGLDMTVIKDKIIAALTGTSALLTGAASACIYGFINKGKQLKNEIFAHKLTKEKTTNYIQQLSDENGKLSATSKSALDKINAEKEELSLQAQDYKAQAESLLDKNKRLLIEQEAKVKQNIADFTAKLPGDSIVMDPNTGNMIKTVTKTVVA
jgi:hypothetical protein